MRRRVFAGIALGIIIYVVLGVYLINHIAYDPGPFVADGAMKLNADQLSDRKTVALRGMWACYPDLLIDPSAETNIFERYSNQRILLEIPRLTTDYQTNYEKGQGYATYRMVVEVPDDGLYGIKTDNIRWAYRIFMNGALATEAGHVSDNADEDLATYLKKTAFAVSQDGRIEIVIQVTNFAVPSSGFVGPIVFGTASSIVQYEKGLLFTQAAVIIGFFCSGYFFTDPVLLLQKTVLLFLLRALLHHFWYLSFDDGRCVF